MQDSDNKEIRDTHANHGMINGHNGMNILLIKLTVDTLLMI